MQWSASTTSRTDQNPRNGDRRRSWRDNRIVQRPPPIVSLSRRAQPLRLAVYRNSMRRRPTICGCFLSRSSGKQPMILAGFLRLEKVDLGVFIKVPLSLSTERASRCRLPLRSLTGMGCRYRILHSFYSICCGQYREVQISWPLFVTYLEFGNA